MTSTPSSEEKNNPPVAQNNSLKSELSEQSSKRKYLIATIIILIFVNITTGWYMFQKGLFFGKSKEKIKTEEIAETQPTKTPTPAEEYDKSDFSIQILNGSGILGVAGDFETVLDDEGFVVMDLGNADNYNYEDTEIRVKKSVPKEYIDELEKVLKIDHKVIIGEKLKETEEVDVIIIIGSK